MPAGNLPESALLAIAETRPDPAFAEAVLQGLKQDPPAIPARWFYDEAGSVLFEKITDLQSVLLPSIQIYDV